MAYEKQTWKTGDVVTSAKLNHMEDGIAGAGDVVVLHVNQEDSILVGDFSYNDVEAYANAGKLIFVVVTNSDGSHLYRAFNRLNINSESPEYEADFQEFLNGNSGSLTLYAATADAPMTYDMEG